MKILSFIQITRPLNVFITFISAIVAILISKETDIPGMVYLLAAISAAITAAGGNIINDYYDIETDKINKPNRPLVTGSISKSSAIKLYISLNLAALIPALFINMPSFIIVIGAQFLLFYYSYRLKRVPAAGNIVIALLTGLVFIYGGAVSGSITNSVIPSIFAFLINLVRELVKDIEDIEGDSSACINTLPITKGINFCKWIIFSITLLLILLTFHPFIFNYYKIEFFIIVMAVVNPFLIFFLKSFFENQSLQNLSRLSNILKLNMLIGLIAIYMGK
ncbi:MAG: geranylgeranylglycerol-phosphate geranylgeranyltransferase [Ignavibacteriaceae bacterium]